MRALEQLEQRRQAGDRQAESTLRTIASGGKTQAGAVPGWNEVMDWGNPNKADELDETREAARALLAGDGNQFDAISRQADASHKDWNGGLIAGALPVVAGALAGGPIGALAAGAVTGGASNAVGLTRGSVGSGLVGGAAKGFAGQAIGKFVSGVPGGAPGGSTSLPAISSSTPAPATGFLDRASSTLARAPAAIGRFVSKNPALATAGLSAGLNLYGAQQAGEMDDREFALREDERRQRMRPRQPFREWQAARTPPAPAY